MSRPCYDHAWHPDTPPGAVTDRVELAVLLAVVSQARPTVRLVGQAVDRSPQRVHHYLVRLARMGLVTWTPGKAGTLRATVGITAHTPTTRP